MWDTFRLAKQPSQTCPSFPFHTWLFHLDARTNPRYHIPRGCRGKKGLTPSRLKTQTWPIQVKRNSSQHARKVVAFSSRRNSNKLHLQAQLFFLFWHRGVHIAPGVANKTKTRRQKTHRDLRPGDRRGISCFTWHASKGISVRLTPVGRGLCRSIAPGDWAMSGQNFRFLVSSALNWRSPANTKKSLVMYMGGSF